MTVDQNINQKPKEDKAEEDELLTLIGTNGRFSENGHSWGGKPFTNYLYDVSYNGEQEG